MWTPREKEIHTIEEIENYLKEVESFHDYRLGNFEYKSENSTASIFVETEHEAKNSSTDGLVWNFEFEWVENFSISMDTMIETWIDEITVKDGSEILFSFQNGYIAVSASKIKFGIPSKI